VLFAIGYSYLTGAGYPRWLPGHIGFVAALASMPIGFGGWLYVWGDAGGLALHPGFSVLVGLPLYGILGLTVGATFSRLRKRSKS
jgi:hypothetical protein